MPTSEDRVVIVTGGGGKGCGRAIAARFAAAGAIVVVSDIDDAGGRETVAAIERARGRATYHRADVRSRDDARELVAFAESTFGALHVVVNNASSTTDEPDIENWINVMETDLLGAMHMSRWAIDAMRRSGGGAIVNIASISALWHGRRTPGGFAGYDVAKAGVVRMTTRLAPLAETDRIRVNCLAPGWIATDGPRQYWESLTPGQRAERGVPARLLRPDQIAAAVERLANDQTLAGRVLVWWSDDAPGLIPWADRGYRDLDGIVL